MRDYALHLALIVLAAWCRCVRYCRTEEGCQTTEINLRAEQIVDEYEQCE